MKTLWTVAATTAVLLLSSGCSTLARPFSGPEAQFSPAGGALVPDEDLPPPEDAVVGGLRVTINSELMNEEFRPKLLEELRRKAAGRYKSMVGETKPPQFEIVITEMTESNGFDTSTIGAVAGGLAGAGTGIAVDQNNRTRGGVVGGAGGALAGAFFFGEQQNGWAFEVIFKQRTSAEGAKKIDTNSRSGTNSGGSLAGTTGVLSGGSGLQERVTSTSFDVTSNTSVTTRYFAVACQGGVFSSDAGRAEAARETLLKRVSDWLMGGADVGF